MQRTAAESAEGQHVYCIPDVQYVKTKDPDRRYASPVQVVSFFYDLQQYNVNTYSCRASACPSRQ